MAGIGGTAFTFSVFSFADGERYFDLRGPIILGVVVPDEQNFDTAIARMNDAVAPFDAGVVLDMRESGAGLGELLDVVDQVQLLLNTLLSLAVLVAALGVVNTMIINVAERRREIALLRAVGATRSQVQQAVMAEAAVLGLIAALIAVALGLAMLALFVIIFAPGGSESVGIRVTWETTRLMVLPALHDWLFSSLLALIFGPLVAALAAYLPARQAAALNVVEATRSERLTLRQAPAKPATRHSLLATHYSPTPTPGHWPGGN